MANPILQHTTPTLGDIIVHDNDDVFIDGVLSPTAIVSHADGVVRVDVNGNGMIDANPQPALIQVRVFREEGWQGALGWRVLLDGWADALAPAATALAVYGAPDGENYQFTTGAFVWMPEYERFGAVCPAGFEPGQADVYFGMLYGSIGYSTFTLHAADDETTNECGGDLP